MTYSIYCFCLQRAAKALKSDSKSADVCVVAIMVLPIVKLGPAWILIKHHFQHHRKNSLGFFSCHLGAL